MSQEIERKFLVHNLPKDLFLIGDLQEITQGYVALDPGGNEVRIREIHDATGVRALLTIKGRGSQTRQEVEQSVSSAVAHELFKLSGSRQIIKERWVYSQEDHTFEVDLFKGKLDGLQVVEVEFESEATARSFTPPDWFGAEVTRDASYKNRSLAVNGVPNRSN